VLAFDLGTATGYSPKRHGTSALAGQQGGDVGGRSCEGQAGTGKRGCAAGRPRRPTCIRLRVIIPSHDHRCAKRVRIAQRSAIPALTISATSGVPIRACRRFCFLPRLLAVS
jgi:hypothetical protein